MKVLLIIPAARESLSFPPLGLGYVGAYLEQAGHDVRLLDRQASYYKKKAIDPVDQESETVVRAFQPDLVGITALTHQYPDAFHFAGLTKHLLPKVPVVLGGLHASILPKETLEASPDIDIVVRGEGEITMQELCDGKEIETVAGVAYRKNGNIVHFPARGHLQT